MCRKLSVRRRVHHLRSLFSKTCSVRNADEQRRCWFRPRGPIRFPWCSTTFRCPCTTGRSTRPCWRAISTLIPRRSGTRSGTPYSSTRWRSTRRICGDLRTHLPPDLFDAAVLARYFDTHSKEVGNAFRDSVFEHQMEINPQNLRGFADKFASDHKIGLPFLVDPAGKP